MANTFSYQTLVDSSKKAVIKITGTLTNTNETSNVKIMGRTLGGALANDSNSNVLVTAAGAVPRTHYRYTVARVMGSVAIPSGYAQLNWDGATQASMLNLSGTFDYNLSQGGLGVLINNAVTPNGNISMTTVGVSGECSYTLILELHKDGLDFNMGQVQRPQDFNHPPFGVTP